MHTPCNPGGIPMIRIVLTIFALTLLAPMAHSHEIGDNSSITIESKVMIERKAPAAWPDARGLVDCVRSGLQSQDRDGPYTLNAYITYEVGTRYAVAITLAGDDGLLSRYATFMAVSSGETIIGELADLVSPAHDRFPDICGSLTNTVITFTPVEGFETPLQK